jgi:hypothetical protein
MEMESETQRAAEFTPRLVPFQGWTQPTQFESVGV